MKDKIAGIARGRIEYELPRISLSKDRIVASVEIGRRLSGRVSISNDAEKSMKGLVCSDNRMVEPVTNQFVGVSNNIEYVIHAESLESLTTVDGALTFITDCGEIELPYHIDVVAPTMPLGAEKIETPSSSRSLRRAVARKRSRCSAMQGSGRFCSSTSRRACICMIF